MTGLLPPQRYHTRDAHLAPADEISEQEAHDLDTPDYLRCDSCLAVAGEIGFGFHRADRHLTTRKLSDSEIIDVVGKSSLVNL